jgi:hypothetical protein
VETRRFVCNICKNGFWARGNTAKYCSPKCRKKADTKRYTRLLEKKAGRKTADKVFSSFLL